MYTYTQNNPVMLTDSTGYMSENTKNILIGVGIIAVLAIVVVATAGIAGVGIGAAFSAGFAGAAIGSGVSGLAVTIAAGAFAGAVTGAVTGGVMSGIIGGAISSSNGGSFSTGFSSGASKGFMFGAASGAVLGGLRGSIAYKNTTPLYRAVSSAEANSIGSNSGFSSINGSFEGKWFFANRTNAMQFGNRMYSSGNFSVVGARVSTSSLSSSSVYYTGFVDFGPGYFYDSIGLLNNSTSGIWFP